MIDEQTDEMTAALQELSHEDILSLLLVGRSFLCGDDSLAKSLADFGLMPKREGNVGDCKVDYALLKTIAKVCDEKELLEWGQALAACLIGDDVARSDALQDLMRRRVAS